VLTLLAWIPC